MTDFLSEVLAWGLSDTQGPCGHGSTSRSSEQRCGARRPVSCSWSVMVKACVLVPQALCLLTSLFGKKVALVEIDPTTLLRSQRRCDVGRSLSVLPRYRPPQRFPLENPDSSSLRKGSTVGSTRLSQPCSRQFLHLWLPPCS